ncbi:MAG: hypothetical protein H7Y07_10330 [Pyrinomonadaceae bacterium]|nr:hypothetical protein [Sphingobacteriaceae bacterium]
MNIQELRQSNNEQAVIDLFKSVDIESVNEFLDHTFYGYITTQDYAESEEAKRSTCVFTYQRLKELFNSIQ